jgi:hypothetical protein
MDSNGLKIELRISAAVLEPGKIFDFSQPFNQELKKKNGKRSRGFSQRRYSWGHRVSAGIADGMRIG